MLHAPRRDPHRRALPAVLVVIGTLAGALAAASPPARAAERPGDLGRVDFPASGAPAAQEQFRRGVAALHSFWYDEAADAFRAAQKADPGFAMAYWGEAMTYNHPIWQEVDVKAAQAALARLGATPAERAAKAPTPREKAYLEAVEVLYQKGKAGQEGTAEGTEGDKPARDRAYAEAMAALAARFPDDREAAAFQALSVLGLTHPGNPADFPALMRAAATLEELLDENPDHPGVLHYLIHIYDDPVHAPLGLRAARRYARVAPAAHHALHMPSHIFVQLGMWPEVAASNEEAWAASVAWAERRGHDVEKRDFHSLSWLGYAYLQQGRLAKAREVLEIARRSAAETKSERVAGGLARMEARYAIETRQWQHAPAPREAGEEGPGHVHGPAAMAADTEGSSVFAAGLAAGFSADPEGAERMAKRLDGLAAAGAGDNRGGYAAQGLRVMEKEVAGLALLARGKKDEALTRLAEAAALEESLPAPSGPPEPAKPALELYGEALLGEGKAKEAAAQFEKSLARTPNRSLSLLGAARAAAKLGEEARARDLYAKLAANWSQADAGVAEVEEAKGYAAAAAR